MNWQKRGESFLRRMLKDERGQALPFTALTMVALLGMAALVVDLGHSYYSYRELQAATDAAALAGAQGLPSSSVALANATKYSALSGNLNAYPNLSNVTMVSGYPQLKCLATLQSQGVACSSPANANAVQVKEQALVPVYFARIFGHNTVTVTATATAAMRGAAPTPYNVVIVVDTTASMNDTDSDSNCSSTRISCALAGVRALLGDLSPCITSETTCGTVTNGNVPNSVDRVSLLTFPPVTTATVANDYNCGSSQPTIYPYAYPMPSTATYQVVNFSSDYRTSDGATSLASGSDIVVSSGGKSNCSGMQAPGGDGTYYAGVIYAAGNYLVAEQVANPASQNVLILISDGDSNAASSKMPGASTTTGTYPSTINQCQQAVTAAKYVSTQGVGGTRVYSVAYGAEASGCSTDKSGITPCETMQQIASAPQYFFSDYTATGSGGCISAAQPTTNLTQIFTQIAGDLTVARLIPDNTT